MKERPILFSGPMVRAILEGRKTQTRRIVKVRNELPPAWATFASEGHSLSQDGAPQPSGAFFWSEEQQPGQPLKSLRRWPILPAPHPMAGDWYWTPSPHGRVGDRLWVRESGVISKLRGSLEKPGLFRHDIPTTPTTGHYWVEETRAAGASYNVEGCSRESALSCYCAKACPSIHMPRWASRITLEITAVRAERLNDCSEDDARAEGSEAIGITFRDEADGKPHLIESLGGPYRDGYRILWESINGPGSWEANPWVWVVEFRRIEP